MSPRVRKQGYTLIETMIVVVVIGIMAVWSPPTARRTAISGPGRRAPWRT
jgi:prepilin-type N-terminal cleavage/methylation domain-containing protein